MVQLFKNYPRQDNESQKYVKFMSCIFEPMEKDLTRERSNMQFCDPAQKIYTLTGFESVIFNCTL